MRQRILNARGRCGDADGDTGGGGACTNLSCPITAVGLATLCTIVLAGGTGDFEVFNGTYPAAIDLPPLTPGTHYEGFIDGSNSGVDVSCGAGELPNGVVTVDSTWFIFNTNSFPNYGFSYTRFCPYENDGPGIIVAEYTYRGAHSVDVPPVGTPPVIASITLTTP